MSISQLKKQFEELAAYLGRDVHGLEKLRKLKESFTEVRTQLASAVQSAEIAKTNLDAAFNETIKAKSELEEMRLENHRLRQVSENLTRDISAAKKPEASPDADDSEVPLKHKQYRAVIKELRRHVSKCPSATSATRHRSSASRTYDRDSFSKGWSHKAIWILGASVAILAAFAGEVTISSNETIADLEQYDPKNPNGKHQFIQWMRDNFDDIGRDAISDIPTHHPGEFRCV